MRVICIKWYKTRIKREKVFVSDLPNLAIDWHPTKNGSLTPYDITAGSGKKVWWKCHVCGYEWEASVCNRARGRGCSYCSKKILIDILKFIFN